MDRHRVPFTQVKFTRGVLCDRIHINRSVTIPIAFAQCEKTGRLWNFERAAASLRGETLPDARPPGYPFDDTDIYKVLEGAAYALSVAPDAELDQYLDQVIDKIAAAQEPDGYLYTTRTLCPSTPHPWASTERWIGETELSHELYNLGHLYEAAVAHFQATGKRSLLDVAIRAADLLVQTFGPTLRSIWTGHPIIEMALVRLSQATQMPEYLELARFLLDERGPDGSPRSGDPYNQSHAPLREQTEVVGHAVRAMYLYSAMADLALADGAASPYAETLEVLWKDLTFHKLYITGGIGAIPGHEGFGAPYELPNDTAYAETCAAIGLVYLCQRLFLLKGDAQFIDVLERVLYNGLLSGVSLDGSSFFYPNPLESKGDVERQAWFGCACCPGNIARFVASIPGYMYVTQGDRLYVNLYGASTAEVPMELLATVTLIQETEYPWQGDVCLTLSFQAPQLDFELRLRIPGFTRGEVVPSDLYGFLDPATEPPEVWVNDERIHSEIASGYVAIQRRWQPGDRVRLVLPMPIRRVVSNPAVTENRGRVALQRGPIVYAVESCDHPNAPLGSLVLADDAQLEIVEAGDELPGMVAITGQIGHMSETKSSLEQPDDDRSASVELAEAENGCSVATTTTTATTTTLHAIPYFAWANRTRGAMQVWLRRGEQKDAVAATH